MTVYAKVINRLCCFRYLQKLFNRRLRVKTTDEDFFPLNFHRKLYCYESSKLCIHLNLKDFNFMNINWNELAATFTSCTKFPLVVFVHGRSSFAFYGKAPKLIEDEIEMKHLCSGGAWRACNFFCNSINSPLNWRAFVQAKGNLEFVCLSTNWVIPLISNNSRSLPPRIAQIQSHFSLLAKAEELLLQLLCLDISQISIIMHLWKMLSSYLLSFFALLSLLLEHVLNTQQYKCGAIKLEGVGKSQEREKNIV